MAAAGAHPAALTARHLLPKKCPQAIVIPTVHTRRHRQQLIPTGTESELISHCTIIIDQLDTTMCAATIQPHSL